MAERIIGPSLVRLDEGDIYYEGPFSEECGAFEVPKGTAIEAMIVGHNGTSGMLEVHFPNYKPPNSGGVISYWIIPPRESNCDSS